MDIHLIFYYIGISIVFLTHLGGLWSPLLLTHSPRVHSVLNLLAGLFIAYYFTNKEGFIKW